MKIKKLKTVLWTYKGGFLFFIILGLIFFLDDTRKINPIEIRKINQTFGCGFDVIRNDWGRAELNLFKQEQKLITDRKAYERRPIDSMTPKIYKRLMLREKEKTFTITRDMNIWPYEQYMESKSNITSCLQFMSQKKVSKFAVDKALKQTTYKLFNEAMTSGGIILVTQIVKECYKDLIYRNFPACIMLDNYASQVDISFRKGMGVKEDNQFFSRLNFISRIKNNFPKGVKYNEYDFLIHYYDQKTHEIYDDYHSKKSHLKMDQ